MFVATAALAAYHQMFWRQVDVRNLVVHNTKHAATYARNVPEINQMVLRSCDRVQSTAPDGGGYFIGVKAVPPESPVGYAASFDGWNMLCPPRSTSYCSGSSYAAFLETLSLYHAVHPLTLRPSQEEALRMQELDGSRREDKVKFWGWWNADGPGCYYAMCSFTSIGTRISPALARAGDFMNIDWKSGLGHSVVFLGWGKDKTGNPGVLFWSSQTGTNGFGDMFATLDRISGVVVVRLTNPEKLGGMKPFKPVETKVVPDRLDASQ